MRLKHWLGLVVLLISLYILWHIRHVLLLGFMAVVLTTALNRAVLRLQRLRINRELAVLLTALAMIASIAFFIWLVALPFGKEFQLLAERTPQGLEHLRSQSVWFQNLIPISLTGGSPDVTGILRYLQTGSSGTFGHLFRFFSSSLGITLDVLLVLFLTFMLLVNPLAYRQAFISIFPAFYRRRADEILSRCGISLGNWFVGMVIIVAIVTVATAIGLWILQVPLVFANALLAGVLSFIPNIGPVVSVIPPVAIALLDSPWKAVGVLVLYVLMHELIGNILLPVVMARQVSLLPAFTLLAQVGFTVLFGFLGLLLAVPLLVVLQIWLQESLVKDVLDRWRTHSSNAIESISEKPENIDSL